MPAGIGRKYIGDMFAIMGNLSKGGRSASTALNAAMNTSMPVGMRGSMASRYPAIKAARSQQINAGKKVAGYGMAGASAMNLLGSDRRGSSYRPASKPINPIPSPQGSGRYA